MRFFRIAVPAFACAIAAIAPGVAAADTCTGADQTPEQLGANVNNVTMCLLNNERTARHLKAFKMNAELSRAALGHSKEMVTKRYFAHNSNSGAPFAARIKSAGWTEGRTSYMIGENIGWGKAELATPAAMVNAWMHSDSHRANILEPRFRMIGIGVVGGLPDGTAGATYSTDFGG